MAKRIITELIDDIDARTPLRRCLSRSRALSTKSTCPTRTSRSYARRSRRSLRMRDVWAGPRRVAEVNSVCQG